MSTADTGNSKPTPADAKQRGVPDAALFRRSRRIRRCGRVHVEKPSVSGIARGVAVPIRGVRGRTLRAVFLASRRLRVLPNHGRGKATGFWGRRQLRERASRRRWARIVIDPEDHGARASVRFDVLRGGDLHATAFVRRHSGAIDACLEAGLTEFFGPRAKVIVVGGGKPAALFNVQKNYGALGKAFLACQLCGGLPIGESALPCIHGIFDFAAISAVEQHHKSKPLRREQFTLALPSAAFLARWRAKPVAGEGKSLTQYRHNIIAGINVEVKAQVGVSGCRRRRRCRCGGRDSPARSSKRENNCGTENYETEPNKPIGTHLETLHQ